MSETLRQQLLETLNDQGGRIREKELTKLFSSQIKELGRTGFKEVLREIAKVKEQDGEKWVVLKKSNKQLEQTADSLTSEWATDLLSTFDSVMSAESSVTSGESAVSERAEPPKKVKIFRYASPVQSQPTSENVTPEKKTNEVELKVDEETEEPEEPVKLSAGNDGNVGSGGVFRHADPKKQRFSHLRVESDERPSVEVEMKPPTDDGQPTTKSETNESNDCLDGGTDEPSVGSVAKKSALFAYRLADSQQQQQQQQQQNVVGLNSNTKPPTSTANTTGHMPASWRRTMRSKGRNASPNPSWRSGHPNHGSLDSAASQSDEELDEESTCSAGRVVYTTEEKEWFRLVCHCDDDAMRAKVVLALELHPDWAKRYDVLHMNALHWAARFGQFTLARLLVEKFGVDVNGRGSSGYTPLHYAAEYGHNDCYKELIRVCRADPQIRDNQGRLASHLFPDRMVKLLFDANSFNLREPLSSVTKDYLERVFPERQTRLVVYEDSGPNGKTPVQPVTWDHSTLSSSAQPWNLIRRSSAGVNLLYGDRMPASRSNHSIPPSQSLHRLSVSQAGIGHNMMSLATMPLKATGCMPASSTSAIKRSLILIGDSTVGKSSLLRCFTDGKFDELIEPTVGVDFFARIIELNGGVRVKLQLWDTAGQERFRSITKSYYRNAVGALVVYDISRRSTFDHLTEWMDEARYHIEPQSGCYMIVGHKSDREEYRQVTTEEGRLFASRYNSPFFETSAKTGSNVNEVFHCLAQLVYDGLKSNKIQLADGWEGIKPGFRPLTNRFSIDDSPPSSTTGSSFPCCTECSL